MIEGVTITPLPQFLDERGKVMKMLSRNDPAYREFGEVYFSCVYPNAIKGWHVHQLMTLNYAVPYGRIKFVLFDDREGSSTKGEIQEIFLGPENYCLVTVPPLVWNGVKGIGGEMALVANCASIPHDTKEMARRDPFDPSIPYNWDIKTQMISVVMPSYNHAQFIGDAIRSVLSQSYGNIELIIVDNYSTDNTQEVISSFQDDRIKLYFFNNNGIIAAARNHGLQKASGDFVAFIDSDDIWFPDKLKIQIDHLLIKDICCVGSNFVPIGQVEYCKNHLSFSPKEEYRDYAYEDIVLVNPVMTSSLLTRKSDIDAVGGFDESADFRFIEDWELWLRMSKKGKVRVLSKPLIQYRVLIKKGRDMRDLTLRRLKIIEKQASFGYLHDEKLLNAALGNCFVIIGKAHLDANDPLGIKFYKDGLRYSHGGFNKIRSLLGFLLFYTPYTLRTFLIKQYYR